MKLLRKFDLEKNNPIPMEIFDELKNYEKYRITLNPFHINHEVYLKQKNELDLFEIKKNKICKVHIFEQSNNIKLKDMVLINIGNEVSCVHLYGF